MAYHAHTCEHHVHRPTLSITQHSSCQLLGLQLQRSPTHSFNWISDLLWVQLRLYFCVCVFMNACQRLIPVIAAGSNHLLAVNIMMESSESAPKLQRTWRNKWKAVLSSASFTVEASLRVWQQVKVAWENSTFKCCRWSRERPGPWSSMTSGGKFR